MITFYKAIGFFGLNKGLKNISIYLPAEVNNIHISMKNSG